MNNSRVCPQCGNSFPVGERQHMKKFCTICSHKRDAANKALRSETVQLLVPKNGKGFIRKARNEEELKRYSSLNGYVYIPGRKS